MIADAIKRQHPELSKIAVDAATIRWTDGGKQRRVMCLTPMVCQQKLAAFDYGIAPKPFKFSMKSTQVTACKVTACLTRSSPMATAAPGRCISSGAGCHR